ncbi:hypothetical protein Tco_1378116 [Tanacetum coccineum]
MGATLSGSQGLPSPQANGCVFNKATKTSHYMVLECVLMNNHDAAFSRHSADMYVVPIGRVVVPTSRYVVPAGKVIIIVSTGLGMFFRETIEGAQGYKVKDANKAILEAILKKYDGFKQLASSWMLL